MSDPSVDLVRHNRSFRWYWLGQTFGTAGHQVTVVALPLVSALVLDAGPSEVGFVATAAMLPYLLFSMVAGHLLESRDKRRTMIPADLAQFLLIGAVPAAWLLGYLTVPLLAAIAFLSGTAALIFGIAGFAYLPQLVTEQQLPAANRAVQGSRTITEIAGPGVAGAAHLRARARPGHGRRRGELSGLRRRRRPRPSPAHHGVASSTRTRGRSHPEEPGVGVDGHADSPHQPLSAGPDGPRRGVQLRRAGVLPQPRALAVQFQGVSAGAYGLALAAGGVGGLLGTLTALALADRLGLGRAFALSLGLSCGVPLLTAAWSLTGAALAGVIAAVMFLAGIGLGNANVYSLTLRQTVIPGTQLARSGGAYSQVMYGTIPIGAALAGVIGETLGTRTGVLLGAAGLVLSALPMLSRRILALKSTHASRDQDPSTATDTAPHDTHHQPRRTDMGLRLSHTTFDAKDPYTIAQFGAPCSTGHPTMTVTSRVKRVLPHEPARVHRPFPTFLG